MGALVEKVTFASHALPSPAGEARILPVLPSDDGSTRLTQNALYLPSEPIKPLGRDWTSPPLEEVKRWGVMKVVVYRSCQDPLFANPNPSLPMDPVALRQKILALSFTVEDALNLPDDAARKRREADVVQFYREVGLQELEPDSSTQIAS